MASDIIKIGITGEQLINVLNNIVSDSFTFNVKDYGAGGGIIDDATAIQLAINAASVIATTTNHGAKVLIPNGDYLIKSVLTLKTNVSVIVDNGAYFYVESGYSNAIWQGDSSITQNCVLNGGRYILNENTTLFKHEQSNNGYFMLNRFSNIYIENCKAVLDLSVVGNGWMNANNFENLNIWRAVNFITNIPTEGNFFSNITFQTWDGKTTSVIENLTGGYNQFNNIMVWDFDVAVQGAYVIHLGDTSQRNIITGGALGIGFEDLGTENYVFSNGVKLTV